MIKGKQLAMDSLLKEAEQNEKEQKKREWAREKEQTDAVVRMLDEKYGRIEHSHMIRPENYPAGSVIIIGQNVFRNDHYTLHFYRTVLDYHASCQDPCVAHMVEAQTEEWPDVPPWAHTVGHEDEPRDMHAEMNHMHWATGEIVEPIKTWWQKKWGM